MLNKFITFLMILENIIESQFTTDFPEDRTLVIKNPERLVRLILEFENEKEKTIPKSGGRLRNSWAAYRNVPSLWENATPFDFQNPEQFLQKQIAQIKDETFTNYSEWEPVAESASLQEYAFVKHVVPIAEYESPHELDIAFSETDPRPVDCLPAVRYGRISEDTVSLRRLYEKEKEHYIEIFGEIPEEILELSSPEEFIVRYTDFLQELAKKNGKEIPDLSEEMRLIHYKFELIE